MQPRPSLPVNDLSRLTPTVSETLAEYARTVLASGHYVMGPWVKRFELEFAGYCGVSDCVGVGNGTDALELALRALGSGPGRHVALAANAAMYATTAALATGAEPAFVDVDPATGLMTARNLREATERMAEPPFAVVITHLYGRMAEMPPLIEYARSLGIAVIEDCAQAHGAVSPAGGKAGSWGDLATFSFYPTKNLGAMGDGGAVTTDNANLADRVRQLRQYGWARKYTNVIPGGRNSRLDELQAAFLCALLPMLDGRNSRRRSIANRYSREISHEAIETPPVSGCEYVAHLYVVQCRQRSNLATHLASQSIATDVHYPVPDHRQPMHDGRYASISLPVTEALCERVLTLPCFPEMTDAEVERVIMACNSWK